MFKEQNPAQAGSEDKSLNGQPLSSLDTTAFLSYLQGKHN